MISPIISRCLTHPAPASAPLDPHLRLDLTGGDVKPSANPPDDPPPGEIELVSIDPVPYLKDLLRRLPGIERRSPGADAELRPLVERGLTDQKFGLSLLVEDPRFDGVLPKRALTLADFRDPTSREKAHREVLGPTVLIVEEREHRYTLGGYKNGHFVAKRLPKPVTQEELVPILESRTYHTHCARRAGMSVSDVSAELRQALQGEAPLAMCIAADVRWQPPHWLAFKSRVARQRDGAAQALVAKVERRFRAFAVDRGGAPRADPVPNDVQTAVRAEWPKVRQALAPVVKALREGHLARAHRQLQEICDKRDLPPLVSAKLISKWIEQKALLRADPRPLAYEILAKKYRLSSRTIKAISASLER
jgi:hypothetical protein